MSIINSVMVVQQQERAGERKTKESQPESIQVDYLLLLRCISGVLFDKIALVLFDASAADNNVRWRQQVAAAREHTTRGMTIQ